MTVLMTTILVSLTLAAAGGSDTVPPSSYDIIQKNKQADDRCLSVLQLHDPSIEIPLMWEYPSLGLGFEIDRDSLDVVRLQKTPLLWISWRSKPAQGSGGYTTGMHLIESVVGNKAVDMLREAHWVWGKQGIGNYQSTSVNFSVSEGKEGPPLTIVRTAEYDDSCRDFSGAVPLGVQSGGMFWRQFRIIEKTEFSFYPDSLKEKSRTSWIDLSAPPLFDTGIEEYEAKQVRLEELSEFLFVFTMTDRWAKPYEDQSAPKPDVEKMVNALVAANSGIEKAQPLRGLIRIPADHPLIEPISPDAEENPLRERKSRGSQSGVAADKENASEALKASDAELNELYRSLMEKLPNDQQSLLKSAQIAWLKCRDLSATLRTVQTSDSELAKVAGDDCLTQLTKERVEYLKAILRELDKPAPNQKASSVTGP